MNFNDMHVDLFKFFQKVIKDVDQSFNNYVDIILDDFFLKEFIILSSYRNEHSYFLICNNKN